MPHAVRAVIAALSLCLAATTSFAQPAGSGVETVSLRGTIGAYRVGAALTLRDGGSLGAAHYFYARHLIDIPLHGTISLPEVTLQEPGGGTFRLHLVGNGSAADQPRTFANSVALQGDWTGAGKTLAVNLQFESIVAGTPDGHRYADVTDQTDAAFEAMVRRFIHGVVSGDRDEAAAATAFPLRINTIPPRIVRNPAALRAEWDHIATPRLIARLREAIPHEMFVHNGMAMFDGGTVWFAAHGAAAINPPPGAAR
jgi:hypothetical protein